jgi:hypothetical protein
MYDEAYMQIFRTKPDDEMLLIRTISKLGCKFLQTIIVGFAVDSISEPIRLELFKRSLKMIEENDVANILLQCFREAIQSHAHRLSSQCCSLVA